jgi:hypothetical protein
MEKEETEKMNNDTSKLIKDHGPLAAFAGATLYAYINLTNKIIPVLLKHNDELDQVITILKQILEQLRARPL